MGKLLEGPRNLVREAYDRLANLPGGKRMFSRFVGFLAPYTSTIGAEVIEVRRGYARVRLADRRAVRNHIDCVHAIALANLAELTGNLALSYSLPDDARFIVAGMEIEYIKKARGPIVGECECEIPETSEKREYPTPVRMLNRDGVVVATATLRTLVGPKPR